MDAVSRILEDRRRLESSLAPWVLAALLLHGAVLGTVVLAARFSPPRVVHMPSVSVELVRLPRARRAPGRAQPPTKRPAPAQPTPAPTAGSKPRPTVPAKTGTATRSPSQNAMPAIAATPRPARPAPVAAVAEGGLELARGGAASPPAIPSDFQFTYYVRQMLALIEGRWYKPPAPAGTRARVRFTIRKDGRVVDIALEEASAVPSFDRAALRALYAANPLPPLPPGYRPASLTVHLAFTE